MKPSNSCSAKEIKWCWRPFLPHKQLCFNTQNVPSTKQANGPLLTSRVSKHLLLKEGAGLLIKTGILGNLTGPHFMWHPKLAPISSGATAKGQMDAVKAVNAAKKDGQAQNGANAYVWNKWQLTAQLYHLLLLRYISEQYIYISVMYLKVLKDNNHIILNIQDDSSLF